MQWTFFTLGLIDTIAGGVLFFNEGLVKFIGVALIGKGVITILKSLT